jgi:hypothetical protein
MAVFNFFFLPPEYTFRLPDSRNWFALAVFLVTSVVVSELAARARRRARESELLAAVATGLLERGNVSRELEVSRDLGDAAVDDHHQGRPVVSATPVRRHVDLPELPWPIEPEQAWLLLRSSGRAPLDELGHPHQQQHPLAVDRDPEHRRRTKVPIFRWPSGWLASTSRPSSSSHSRYELHSVSEIACPRQTSVTDQSPRKPASTIPSLGSAVQLQYLRCSLDPISLSVERPMPRQPPDDPSRAAPASEISRRSKSAACRDRDGRKVESPRGPAVPHGYQPRK